MTSIMKHQAAIALLVAILPNFSNCDYCPVSAPTVSVVSKCPTTKTEWDEAASRKKCSHMSAKCGDKSPVYHCLLNQWRNETVEVCASNWFISGFCAIYNTEEMKVIDDFNRDCTNFTDGPCPTRYISTDTYMYQGCYGKRNTSTPLPSTERQVHVSTDCTLSDAIIAIIIVFSLLSLGLFVLLVLTCQGLISTQVINQFIRSSKNTTDEENGESEERLPQTCISPRPIPTLGPSALGLILESRADTSCDMEKGDPPPPRPRLVLTTSETHSPRSEGPPRSPLSHLDVEREDTSFRDEDKNNETKPLLLSDQEAVTTPTDKSDDGISTIFVKERIRKFDPGNTKETHQKDEDKWKKSRKNLKTSLDASDTDSKDENCRGVYETERELMYNGQTDSPNDDHTLESKVEDAKDNMKDIKTKDEDFVMNPLGGKAISDGQTDSPNEDQTVECNFEDKDVKEDDRLPGNDLKVTETQNMQSSDEEIEGTENRSKSQKELENDERNNTEEGSSSTESNLTSNRENKTSSEKEERLVAEENTYNVKNMVKKFQTANH